MKDELLAWGLIFGMMGITLGFFSGIYAERKVHSWKLQDSQWLPPAEKELRKQ